ncbi:MAG: MFS transporter [Clostridia bacterium]|nr:MFS transporter [Clostridia bacterium]
MKKDKFTQDQKMIIALSMIAYSVLYFMRLNISLSFSGMERSFQVTPEELGIVSSAFFWCYAFGQLIFGFLGDRLPARYMVFIGLMGSGILNLAIGQAQSFVPIIFLWAFNGIFQSMLWSPIVKCVAKYFDGSKKVVASFLLSITQVIGYMLAWVGSYFLDQFAGWRFVFIVPAVAGIVFSLVWLVLFRYQSTGSVEKRTKGTSLIRQPILLGFLGVIALFSILFGLVKSSIDTWMPTMISDVGNLPEEGIVVTLLLIPLVNFFGIMLAKIMVKRLQGDIYKSILFIWGGALIVSLISLIFFRVNPIVFVIIIAVLFGFVYGQTPLFTSFIPLDFVKWDCVSTVTGFVDFAIYVGAGITGMVSGLILGDGNTKNWSALSIYWFILLAIGMVFAIFTYYWHRRLRKKINQEESEWD